MDEREQLEARLRIFFRQWYRQHGRAFPWREPGVTPFGILIAEMLLRQTRASMAAPVWETFISRYPSPAQCLDASNDELLPLFVPLGFGMQRLGAVRGVCEVLVGNHRGKVPRSIDVLVAIPHLGLYSAHAIACFAYNQRVPVVDVNVLRVFSRLTGEDYGRDNRRGRAPEAWELARRILPSRNVKQHNYGLLDFSAQICIPRHPRQEQCPLAGSCAYYFERVDAISRR